MQEQVLKISHSNVDDNTWRKGMYFVYNQIQMAKRICESCQAQWNKNVVVATSKVQKCQEFLSEKSAWVKSNSHDKVRAHEQLQSTHSCAFQPHRNTGIWGKQTSSAVLVVFCVNYPSTEHCCKDPIYGFIACFQTLPCTEHVALSKRWPKSNRTKSSFLCQGSWSSWPPVHWKEADVTSQSLTFTPNSMCIGEFSLHRWLAAFLKRVTLFSSFNIIPTEIAFKKIGGRLMV